MVRVDFLKELYDIPAEKCELLVMGADDTILYTAGQCKNAISLECDELMSKAEEYLNTNYPGWKDPTKYWD